MLDALIKMFSYQFFSRAVIAGLLVSLCASLLGVSLVLKRYSMIGDGLSHVGFGSLAFAASLNAAPLGVALPVVGLAAVLLLRLRENSRIGADAAIAMISAASLAAGVMIISVTGGMNTDLYNYLFGSILTMSAGDLGLCVALACPVLLLFILSYNKIFAITFDETFARATGVRAGTYKLLLALLTAVIIVLGMRMMGALLISSLIIFPAVTAMRVCRRFLTVTVCAALVSALCFLLGIVGSFVFNTPTGASVVAANTAALAVFSLAGALKGRPAR